MTWSTSIPCRLESRANANWSRGKRIRLVREMRALGRKSVIPHALPVTVTLTRIAPRALDGDNLQNAFKAIRDGIADRLGVDDRDSRVTWQYGQERGQPRQYAVRIKIEPVRVEVAA